jgi:hypothetical protein
MFGLGTAVWSGGIYGASLFGNIWSMTHKEKQAAQTYDFDVIQNNRSSEAMIPIIYGTRKWGGYQTWHEASTDKQTLTKDVVMCEGEITRLTELKANDLWIQTETKTTTVNLFTITVSDDVEWVKIQKSDPGICSIQIKYYSLTYWQEVRVPGVGYRSIVTEDIVYALNQAPNKVNPRQHGIIATTLNNVKINEIPYTIINHNTTHTVTQVVTTVTQQGLPGCSVETHNGSPWQAPPSNYNTVGGYKNCAWLRATLKSSDKLQGSDPTITAVIQGMKVYDTRTGAKAYSENPAMCLRDYILSKRYGLGRWVTSDMLDEDSFKECADQCDGEVHFYTPTTLATYDAVQNKITDLQRQLTLNPGWSSKTVDAVNDEITALQKSLITIQSQPVSQTIAITPRYSCNLILADKTNHIDNLETIMATFGGFLVYNGKKISLRMEKQEVVSYAFNDSNICSADGKPDIVWETTSLAETPNRYIITFYDPNNNWTGVKCQVNDVADQKFRGRIIEKEVSLDGVTNQSQALRLGRIFMAKNRLNTRICTFKTGTHAMHLQPGDVISFTHEEVSNMPLRILQMSEEQGKFTIKAQEYNISIYDDRLGSQITTKNYCTIPNAFTDTIPEVTAIALDQDYYIQKDGTAISTITGVCTLPNYPFTRIIHIYSSTNNGTTWNYCSSTTTGEFTLHSILVNQTYYIKAIVENTAGRKSNGFISNPLFITGKDKNPSDVPDFVVAQFGHQFVLQGKIPSDVDFNHIEVRVDGTSWETSKYLATDITSFPTYISNSGIIDGTHVFRAKAVDNGGNYSTNDIEYILNVTDINTYKNIILTRDDVLLGGGTLTGLTVLPNGQFVSSNSITYGDFETYADYPETYGADQTSIGYLSPVIDTFKVGKTNVNFCFDFDFYVDNPTYGTLGDRTYGDYPNDTYGHITEPVDITIEIRLSDDGNTWSVWQTYVSAQYNFRYIQYRITANYEDTATRATIKSLLQYYDVPDATYSQTLSIPATGINVDYGGIFYETPTQITPTVINGSGNVYPDITNSTASGLHIDCYDRTGTKVAGTVLLVCKGY